MPHKTVKLNLRNIIIASTVVLILVGVGLWLTLRPTSSNVGGIIPSSNPLAARRQPGSSAQTKSTSNDIPSSSSAQSSGPAPIEPYGDFVSSHHPGASTSEASACNTSPGATCYIQFTQGSLTKKLNPQTTNANGAALWYWNIQSAGLSQGNWQITTVANLNGHTVSVNDSLPLVVQ